MKCDLDIKVKRTSLSKEKKMKKIGIEKKNGNLFKFYTCSLLIHIRVIVQSFIYSYQIGVGTNRIDFYEVSPLYVPYSCVLVIREQRLNIDADVAFLAECPQGCQKFVKKYIFLYFFKRLSSLFNLIVVTYI